MLHQEWSTLESASSGPRGVLRLMNTHRRLAVRRGEQRHRALLIMPVAPCRRGHDAADVMTEITQYPPRDQWKVNIDTDVDRRKRRGHQR